MRLSISLMIACVALFAMGYVKRAIVAARLALAQYHDTENPLPEGLVAVEYLESDGEQYIKDFYIYTGLETSVGVSIGWMKVDNVKSGQNFIFGVDKIGATNVSGPRFAQYQDGTRFSCDSGGWLNLGLRAIIGVYYKTDFMFSYPNIVSASMNDGTPVSGTRDFHVVEGSYSILFRIASAHKLIGRIYFAKMYIDGVLVRDMIPVRFLNENKAVEGGMYDFVEGELFRNVGTGEFVIGPDL